MLRTLLAFVTMCCASGCYTMNADLPGTWRPASPAEDVVIVGRVDKEVTQWFLLYGLLPSPPRTLYSEPLLLAVEAAGGDGVANIVIDTQFTATDVLVRTFTLGLASPRTYRVRADIVQLPGPAPPGRALLKQSRRRVQPAPSPMTPLPAPPVTAPEPPPPSVPPPASYDPLDAPPPILGPP